MSGLTPLSNDIIALRITCDARKPMIFCQFVRISAEIQTIMPACALFPVSSSVALRSRHYTTIYIKNNGINITDRFQPCLHAHRCCHWHATCAVIHILINELPTRMRSAPEPHDALAMI